MATFSEDTEYEERPEFDDNGEPIIYIDEDIIPDEFASEDDGVIDLDVQDESFYETIWGEDTSAVATLVTDDSSTEEEVTDPLEVEVEEDTEDTKENDGILEDTNEEYSNAVETLIDILTHALAEGEITEEMNASILDAQATKTKNEQIIKDICNAQEDNSILEQLEDIKADMVPATVDDILDVLTEGGTKPWLYKDSDNNVLVDSQSIPELTVLVNKLNLIATGGDDDASEIQLTPEFINMVVQGVGSGDSVKGVTTMYYLSTSKTELIGGTWVDTLSSITEQQGKYLWYKIVTTYMDTEKEPTESEPVCLSGNDGIGVEELIIQKAKNQSTTEPPTDGWSTLMPEYEEGYYLWYRTRIKYSNSLDYIYSDPVCDQSWNAVQEVHTQYKQLKDKFTWIVSGDTQSEMTLTDEMLEIITKQVKITGDMIVDGALNGKTISSGRFSSNPDKNNRTIEIDGSVIKLRNLVSPGAGFTLTDKGLSLANSGYETKYFYDGISIYPPDGGAYTTLSYGGLDIQGWIKTQRNIVIANGKGLRGYSTDDTEQELALVDTNDVLKFGRGGWTNGGAVEYLGGDRVAIRSKKNVYLNCNGGNYDSTNGSSIVFLVNSSGDYVFRPVVANKTHNGTGTYYWASVSSKEFNNTSDRTLKENIKYLSNAQNVNSNTADITIDDCYNFVKNDLPLATYNYKEDDRSKIGFIAQDIIYNADESDNKIGQIIVNNLKYKDENGKLTYDINNLVGVDLAATQKIINKVEELEKEIKKLKGE